MRCGALFEQAYTQRFSFGWHVRWSVMQGDEEEEDRNVLDETSPVTPSFCDALITLQRHLHGAARYLDPTTSLPSLTRRIRAALDTLLWDDVLRRHHFNAAGARQLHRDMANLWLLLRPFSRGRPENAMKRVKESLRLLNLDHAVADVAASVTVEKAYKTLYFGASEDVLDVGKQRFLQETLSIHTLSLSEARDILGRRLDLVDKYRR